MIKRITLLLAMLLAVGSYSTVTYAQDEEESGTSTTETKPADGGGEEPECD